MSNPTFSVCVPLFNRSRHLAALLESVLGQSWQDFEIVLSEDCSPERPAIREIVQRYQGRRSVSIKYFENAENLGYDANIRHLIDLAEGRYCFFMGNDDLMCAGALAAVADLVKQRDVGLVLKSYAWFDEDPAHVNQEVRFFSTERTFRPGREAMSICFRRCGVISGYVILREAARKAATDQFDGTLYYQLYLTGSVLAHSSAVFSPRVLVLCRNSEPPDFGHSSSERQHFKPGKYTPEARVQMVSGALRIAKHIEAATGITVFQDILADYANYFYPYIKDQLSLPVGQFLSLYLRFCRLGFYRYPLFHVYFLTGYLLGERRFDSLTRQLRKILGRSPQFGVART
jgi:glycosyltransferase involved in cell wall biosynthesis